MADTHRKILVANEISKLTIQPAADEPSKARLSAVWRLAQRLRTEVFKEREFRENLKTDTAVFAYVSRTQSFPSDPSFNEALKEVAEGKGGPAHVGIPAQKAAGLLCEARETVAPTPPPEMRIDWFTGTVNAIDGEVAYVTLLDEDCKEHAAQLNSARVVEAGLKQGDHFLCLLTGDGDRTEMELIRREKQPITDEQRKGIHLLVREAVQLLSETDHAAPGPESKAKRR
jgi:hypothetical protein